MTLGGVNGGNDPVGVRGGPGSGDAAADEFDLSAVPTAALADLVLEQQAAQQRQHAGFLAAIAEADERRIVHNKRWRTLALWVADELNLSPLEAGRTVKLAQLVFVHHPELGAAYGKGSMNLGHLRLFTRVWNKSELRPALARDLADLIGWCRRPWWECSALFRAWEILVDPIDPNDHAAKAHDKRGLTFAAGLDYVVFGEFTTTTEFMAQFEPVLRAKADELFAQDWAWVQERHGEDACLELLPRNDKQRWHDALMIIVRQGASLDDPGSAVDCAVITDAETLMTEAEQTDTEAAAAAGETGGGETGTEAGDGGGDEAGRCNRSRGEDAVEQAESYRCETSFGRPVAPRTALDFAIAGHLRLFMMNTPTKSFEASDRKRLFKGALREGIMLRDRFCTGDGCDTHASRCDADHHVRHTDGGCTSCENGRARCGPCHRHKTRLEALGMWPPGLL